MVTTAVIATVVIGGVCAMPALTGLLTGHPPNLRLLGLALLGAFVQVWWIGLFCMEFYRNAFAM